MNAKSIKGKSPEEIKTTLLESMSDGFEPTLAFIFISIDHDKKTISAMLVKEGIEEDYIAN